MKSRICYPIGEAAQPKTIELTLQIGWARAARYPFQTSSKKATNLGYFNLFYLAQISQGGVKVKPFQF